MSLVCIIVENFHCRQKMSSSPRVLGISGSVARKIALFQIQDETGPVPVESGSGTLRLRRKDGIKRKKSISILPKPLLLRSGDDVADDAACADSTVSSDSCYGGSSLDERQGHPSLESSEVPEKSRNHGGSGGEAGRTMRDCYQSFTLPRRRHLGSCHLQLVEFSSADLSTPACGGRAESLEAYYEELNNEDSTDQSDEPSAHLSSSSIKNCKSAHFVPVKLATGPQLKLRWV